MDMTSLGISGVAAITIICYLVGETVKITALNNKYIPVIVGACGALLGIPGMLLMPDFPATDYLTAVAVGIVSGLAATGLDQMMKQVGGDHV